MNDDLETRVRAHYRSRDPGPAPDELRRRVDASLAAEGRRTASWPIRIGGRAGARLGAVAAVATVVLVATAGLLLVARPWQGQELGSGGAAATPDPRCASLTIDDVVAALRDVGSYRYTVAGFIAPADGTLGPERPLVRREVTGTGQYAAPDRYVETWQTGEAAGGGAAGLSMADTLRVGSDQWTRDSAAVPLLWEKLLWPGSSDPRGGLIRLNWIDFERERAGWAPDPGSDLVTGSRCGLVGGPGMLDTGGEITVWLAVDPATALPAAMRVEIDNTVGSDARLDHAVEYGVPVDVEPPGPDEVAPPSASPTAEQAHEPAAPVPEPIERPSPAGSRGRPAALGNDLGQDDQACAEGEEHEALEHGIASRVTTRAPWGSRRGDAPAGA